MLMWWASLVADIRWSPTPWQGPEALVYRWLGLFRFLLGLYSWGGYRGKSKLHLFYVNQSDYWDYWEMAFQFRLVVCFLSAGNWSCHCVPQSLRGITRLNIASLCVSHRVCTLWPLVPIDGDFYQCCGTTLISPWSKFCAIWRTTSRPMPTLDIVRWPTLGGHLATEWIPFSK